MYDVSNHCVLRVLAEQDMDGEAIAEAFGTCSGPDCLKDILPKFGPRVKVYNALKLSLDFEMTSEVHNSL